MEETTFLFWLTWSHKGLWFQRIIYGEENELSSSEFCWHLIKFQLQLIETYDTPAQKYKKKNKNWKKRKKINMSDSKLESGISCRIWEIFFFLFLKNKQGEKKVPSTDIGTQKRRSYFFDVASSLQKMLFLPWRGIFLWIYASKMQFCVQLVKIVRCFHGQFWQGDKLRFHPMLNQKDLKKKPKILAKNPWN